ncbi:MAG: thioredoxin domain-containing protein [Gemmatimonas sp.]
MKKSAWSSPLAVFALVFSAVLSCGMLVVRELRAGGRLPSRSNVASSKETQLPALPFVTEWRALADSGAARDTTYGSATAPVQVVVFADYQCAGCAALHGLLDIARDSLPAHFAVSVRHYPLSMHPHARAAANAAECARDQQRLAAFEAELYGSQAAIGVRSYTDFAIRAQISDTSRFADCVRAGTHIARVDADRARANDLKFPGTPVYIINGQPHFGAPSLAVLLAQLRAHTNSSAPSAAPSAGDSPATARALDATPARPLTKIPAQAVRLEPAHLARKREWSDAPRLLRSITGTPGDELLIPGSLATSATGDIVVFDFGSMELRAFNTAGQPRWRIGRKGGGPGEFRNAMDVKATNDSNLAVIDMGNRRITVVNAAGKLRRMIPVPLSGSRLIPLAKAATYALTNTDSGGLWVSIDARGTRIARNHAPADLATRDGLEREAYSTPTRTGSALSFRWSDQLAILDHEGRITRRVNGIEPVPFPGIRSYPMKMGRFSGHVSRINPRAPEATRAITSDGERLYVLFSGTSTLRGRIVDVYDADSANYKGSFELPSAATELTALPNGLMATLRLDPIPTIDVWSLPSRFRTPPAQRDVASRQDARGLTTATIPATIVTGKRAAKGAR